MHREELHVRPQSHDHLSCHLGHGRESYPGHLYALEQPVEGQHG
jgi:hypothetical protein